MFKNEDKGEGPDKRLLPPFVEYVEWVRLSCVSILLFIAGVYVPFAGVAIALASPAPIALVALRQGAFKAFLAAAFASAAVSIPFETGGAISFALTSGVLGVALGVVPRRLKSAGEGIFALVIVSLISKLAFMQVMISVGGHNPFALDENVLRELFRSLDVAGGDDVLKAAAQQIRQLTPSFIIMASGLDAFVNYLLVSKLSSGGFRLFRGKEEPEPAASALPAGEGEARTIPPVPPFGDWAFPRSLLTAFFAAFLIGMLDAARSQMLASAEINLKILTSVMFFIQGLSSVWWMMLHKNFSRGVRLAVLTVLLFVPIFAMGLILIGIVDIAFNLREKIRRNDK